MILIECIQREGRKMKTAVIYARYSSDLQKDRSIDDQISDCRRIAERHGYRVIETYTDRAKSGASMFERDGLLALMQASQQGKFNAVIVESLSRLSRDQEDTAGIFKRLDFKQVKIFDSSGEITKVHVGVGGIVNSFFLSNLATSVKRGMDGRAREGLIPGRVAYGYRPVPGKPGAREVHPPLAKIVRRIFREYANGVSPRAIAAGLARDGIPSPRGDKHWNYRRLLGGSSGLLVNPLYIGKVVLNRRRNVRNPDSGKIQHRKGEAENIITVDVPHLRIVEQELWDQAQAVREERGLAKSSTTGGRTFAKKPEHYLVPLLKCDVCGGRMIIGQLSGNSDRRVVCAAWHRNANCSHRKSYDLATLEAIVLEGIKTKLTDRKALIEFTKAYHGRWAERQKEIRSDRDTVQRQLNKVEVQINRIVDAIASAENDDDPVELMKRMKPLRIEKAGLMERLKVIDAETNVVTLHPKAMDDFANTMEELHAGLSSKFGTEQLAPFRMAFCSIFDRIVVHQTAKRKPYEVTPYARLGAIMGVELFPKMAGDEEMLAEQGVEAGAKTPPSAQRSSDTFV
jgi:site-specific DNA recombinase